MTEKLIVRVDSDLSDLVPGFLANKREDTHAILEAAMRMDYGAVGRLAHRIKGEGGSYGFDQMTDIGRRLESAARSRDPEAVTNIAHELLVYLDTIEVIYQPAQG